MNYPYGRLEPRTVTILDAATNSYRTETILVEGPGGTPQNVFAHDASAIKLSRCNSAPEINMTNAPSLIQDQRSYLAMVREQQREKAKSLALRNEPGSKKGLHKDVKMNNLAQTRRRRRHVAYLTQKKVERFAHRQLLKQHFTPQRPSTTDQQQQQRHRSQPRRPSNRPLPTTNTSPPLTTQISGTDTSISLHNFLPGKYSKSLTPNSNDCPITVPTHKQGHAMTLTGTQALLDAIERPIDQNYFGKYFSTTWSSSDFSLGEIVLAPWYAPNMNPALSFSDRDCAYAAQTGPIVAKMRPCIVVGKLPDGLLTVPVRSYGGNGDTNLTPSKREYILRLKDREDDDVFWDTLHKDSYLVSSVNPTKCSAHCGWRPRPASFVDVSATWTVERKWPVRKLCAGLMPEELRRLVEAVWFMMDFGARELRSAVQAVDDAAQAQIMAREERVRELPHWLRADVLR